MAVPPRAWNTLQQNRQQRLHGLHMLQSVQALTEHLDVFERGVAGKLRIGINDVGATPAVVSLRLAQAMRTCLGEAA